MNTTPLYARHIELGASMVPFAGYDMPVKYGSEKAEHLAVRTGAGLFDVSHMGEIWIEGDDSVAFLQKLLPADAGALKVGKAKYTMLLNEAGGIIDDILLYRFGASRFLLCTNAGNQEVDFQHVMTQARRWNSDGLTIKNLGPELSQIALQGPQAAQIVSDVLDVAWSSIPYYEFVEASWKDEAIWVSRTGYTGEDGFEFYLPNAQAEPLWDLLLQAGAQPCGLAARDTLRLEAGMCLHGNDIRSDVTPLQGGLNWTIDWSEERSFIGKDALLQQKDAGLPNRLRGFVVLGRGIIRPGTALFSGNQQVGIVTSGTMSPSLGKAIGIAHIDSGHWSLGNTLEAELRGRRVEIEITKIPFYKRKT